MNDALFNELLDPATPATTLAIRFAAYEMAISTLLVRNPSTPARLIDGVGFMTAVCAAGDDIESEDVEWMTRDLAYYLQHPNASAVGIEDLRTIPDATVQEMLRRIDAMDLPDLFAASRAGGVA